MKGRPRAHARAVTWREVPKPAYVAAPRSWQTICETFAPHGFAHTLWIPLQEDATAENLAQALCNQLQDKEVRRWVLASSSIHGQPRRDSLRRLSTESPNPHG